MELNHASRHDASHFAKITVSLIQSIGLCEIEKLLKWEFCEMSRDFLGFLENYVDLQSIPNDFIIIDAGCGQAFQSYYFKDKKQYIGIDPAVPNEWRLKTDNSLHYYESMQTFVAKDFHGMKLDIDKTFVICSAVPDEGCAKVIEENFKYYRIVYPGAPPFIAFPEFLN